MLNADDGPLSDINVRKALQLGIDREELNETVNNGLPKLAEGPFAPGNVGHLESTGWPKGGAIPISTSRPTGTTEP